MKILHWLGAGRLPENPDLAASSGVVRATLELAVAQRQIGHVVTVASVSQRNWTSFWEGVELVGRRPARWARIKRGSYELSLAHHVPLWVMSHVRRFDVVHAQSYGYLRGIRAPVRVVHFHSDPLAHGWDQTPFSSEDFRTVCRDADVLIVVSRYVEAKVRSGVADGTPVVWVPNGVRFSSSRSAKEVRDRASQMRRELGIPPEGTVIVFAGAVVEQKGLHVLAKAYAHLRRTHKDLYLVVAGGSDLWMSSHEMSSRPYEDGVRRSLTNSIQERAVHFLGTVTADDMQFVYAMSNLVVVPSIVPEAFPLVCLEAMLGGKPVVASRVGGLPELVSGQTGRLFEVGNVDDLANAIEELRADVRLRDIMGGNAQRKATEFTWHRAATMVDDAYRSGRLRQPNRR